MQRNCSLVMCLDTPRKLPPNYYAFILFLIVHSRISKLSIIVQNYAKPLFGKISVIKIDITETIRTNRAVNLLKKPSNEYVISLIAIGYSDIYK